MTATQPALTAAPRRKARVLLRILAVVVVAVVGIFCGGAVAAAINNVAHPGCAEVAAGTATLPADGACYHGSLFQQYGTLVTVFLGAGGVGFAVLLSIVLLFTGQRGRWFVYALGTGVAFLLIGALITHA